jgi:hypothetical protein
MVEEIKDGYLINRDTMNVVVSCLNPEVYYNLNNQKLIGAIVFDQQGKRIDVQDERGNPETNNLDPSFYVKLKPGANKLGFNIYGNRRDFKTKEGVYIKQYIDFKWITVNCIPLTIDPNPLKGQPNKELKLTARSKGAAPKSAKYIWNFGDGTSPASVVNDSIVNHTFPKEGKFTIKLELYDNSTNKKLTEVVSVAEIAQNFIITPKLLSGFLNNLTVNYVDQDKKVFSKNESFSFVTSEIPAAERGTIAWSGNSFSYFIIIPKDEVITYKRTWVISGTLSADQKTLLKFSYKRIDDSDSQGTGTSSTWTREIQKVREFTIENVPRDSYIDPNAIRFKIVGSNYNSYKAKFDYSEIWVTVDTFTDGSTKIEKLTQTTLGSQATASTEFELLLK